MFSLELVRDVKQSTKLIITKLILAKLYFNFVDKFYLASSINLQLIYQILFVFKYLLLLAHVLFTQFKLLAEINS